MYIAKSHRKFTICKYIHDQNLANSFSKSRKIEIEHERAITPAIMAKIANEQTSWEVSPTASVTTPWARASVSPSVTSRRWTSAVSSSHFSVTLIHIKAQNNLKTMYHPLIYRIKCKIQNHKSV